MAHFAKIDENNIVTDILVVSNEDIQNLPFPESEAVGIAYLNSFLPPAAYKQTSYNSSFRLRYAMVGGTFLPDAMGHGVFVPAKTEENFVFDAATYEWVPPIPYPSDGVQYYWNVPQQKWSPIVLLNTNITVLGE